MRNAVRAQIAGRMVVKTLVLGSSGRIGTMLRRVWDVQTGADQSAFRYQTRQANTQGKRDLLWDLNSPLPLDMKALAPFDVLLVLSGVVPRAGAVLAQNTAIGLASLEAAAVLGAGTVLLASSSAVYGTQSDKPYHEADTPAPANDYGRAKLEMEHCCAARAAALGVRLCNLRIGNVAGADALLCNGAALAKGEALRIERFADGGTPLRSYIGPQTLARVLKTLILNHANVPKVLNVAAPDPVQMAALAKAAAMPFDLVPATGTAHQTVTLDCGALGALHQFDTADSNPAQMVAQWQSLRND